MSVNLKLRIDDLRSETRTAQSPCIAAIGAGAWGKNIVRNLHELGALNAICDANEETLLKCKALYPDLHFTTNYDDVLNSEYINAVVIATPAATHYELAKKALLAKKHVYVEKPLALNLDEAKELVELSEKSKCILMVGHILRYHPAVIML